MASHGFKGASSSIGAFELAKQLDFAQKNLEENPQRKKQMIEFINETSSDLACFQEMVAGDSARGRINYTAEFTKKLKMKYYYYSYNPIFDFGVNPNFSISLWIINTILDMMLRTR